MKYTAYFSFPDGLLLWYWRVSVGRGQEQEQEIVRILVLLFSKLICTSSSLPSSPLYSPTHVLNLKNS
jgi:hypothetical protein